METNKAKQIKNTFYRLLDEFCNDPCSEEYSKNLSKQINDLYDGIFTYSELENIAERLNACGGGKAVMVQNKFYIYMEECHKGLFTQAAETASNEIMDKFSGLYCIADFENALRALEEAIPGEERNEVLGNLYEMFSSIGLKCEKGHTDPYYRKLFEEGKEKKLILTAQEYEDKVIYELFCRSREFRCPEEYMERTVNDLTADHPVFSKDAWNKKNPSGNYIYRLPTRILKQFVKYGGRAFLGKQQYIIDYAVSKQKGKTLPDTEPERAAAAADLIDDDIFDIFEELDRAAEATVKAVDKTAEKKEILNAVNILNNFESDNPLKNTFVCERLRSIETSLTKGKKEFSAEVIKKKFRQAVADYKKPGSSKLWLIREAFELGNGIFSEHTKEYLYHFAIVYDMTLFTDDSRTAEKQDEKTDVEYQLFGKYYINNVMRFYTADRAAADKLMSEQGINDKNYAEECFLYNIAKPSVINSDETGWAQWSPEDKLKKTSEMIRTITKALNNAQTGRPALPGEESYTGYCKERRNHLLTLSEKDFKNELCREFQKVTGFRNNKITDPMKPGREQNTAYSVYKSLINAIRRLSEETEAKLDTAMMNEDLRMPDKTGTLPPEECNYGLWVPDITAYNNGRESLPDRNENVDRNDFAEFMNMLEKFNDMTGITFEEGDIKEEGTREHHKASVRTAPAMNIKNAQDITRTSILAACYYFYTQFHLKSRTNGRYAFCTVFDDFKAFADDHLKAAYYMEVRPDNLFDVLIAFSAYAYLNF